MAHNRVGNTCSLVSIPDRGLALSNARRQPGARLGWVLLGLYAFTSAAFAEPAWKPSGETECRLAGWAIDADPKGLNVRAAASATSPVLGTLPAYVVNPDYNFGIEFEIVGSRDGWLKITGAKDDPGRSELPPRPTYAGTGWVSGNLVRFGVQSSRGYAKPDAASARLFDFGSDWLSDRAEIEHVVACQGKWALLDIRLISQRDANDRLIPLSAAESQRGRAWFRGTCGIQETTCDQANPDSSAP